MLGHLFSEMGKVLRVLTMRLRIILVRISNFVMFLHGQFFTHTFMLLSL